MSQDVTHNAFDQNDDVAIEAFGPAWNTDKISTHLTRAMAQGYMDLFYVNKESGAYIEYRYDNSLGELVEAKRGANFFEACLRDAEQYIHPEDREDFVRAADQRFLTEDPNQVLKLTFRRKRADDSAYVNIKVSRMDDDARFIVIAVTEVDEVLRQRHEELRMKEEREVYARLHALTGNFIVVYVVDPHTESYREFNATEEYVENFAQATEGTAFFEKVRKEAYVYNDPRDLDRFLTAFSRENVMSEVARNGIFTLEYRVMMEGKPIYVQMKAAMVEEKEGPRLVVGLYDVDVQVQQREAGREVERQRETYNQITASLAEQYDTLYYIDIANGTYIEISSTDEYKKLNVPATGNDFFAESRRSIRKYVHAEDQERVLSIHFKDAMLNNLKHRGSFSMAWRLVVDGKVRHIRHTEIMARDKKHIIVCIKNIDAEVRAELALKETQKQSVTYTQIAERLASHFDLIYYIDCESSNYAEFSTKKKSGELRVQSEGDDFFEASQRNVDRLIHPEDRDRLRLFLNRDYLISQLETRRQLIMDYRMSVDGGQTQYTRLSVTYSSDYSHFIICIENRDKDVRREKEHLAALSMANEMARRDDLTHTKNKTAYHEMEKELQNRMEAGCDPFGIVVCDINGLKAINDTQGHKAGDEYIRTSCMLICRIFSHSPVFRIGGDEFAVLLRGQDYENRESLLATLRRKVEENVRIGEGPVVASGMADYNTQEDHSIGEIFERADKFMYEDKTHIKEMKLVLEAHSLKERASFTLITEERRAKLDMLYKAFEIVSEGSYVYLCDMKYDYSRWSKSAVDAFGLPSEYMYGAGDIWENRIHPEDRMAYHKGIEEIFAGKAAGHDMQYRAKRVTGEYNVCTCRGIVLRDQSGEPDYFVGTIRNHGIQGHIDALTGLRNQYGFFEDLEGFIKRNTEIIVILFGISKFSEINEIYGYHFGNRVLQLYSRSLYEATGNEGHSYRIDGTKFAIISNTLSIVEMRERYNRFREFLHERFQVDGRKIMLDLHCGALKVDNFAVDSQTVYACLNYADEESKIHKQGELVEFRNDLNGKSHQRLEMLHAIRASIMRNYEGFYLLFQPVVDAQTEQLIGAEALLRWRNDRYGTVPPDEFIPILESDPLFPELGEWILREAILAAKQIMKKNPGFVINVNLSYTQLQKPDFVDMVLRVLTDLDYSPECLCLEVTERCRLLDLELLKNVVASLKARGVLIALDDFGTGFSSIGILKEIPFNIIKIDRSFVRMIEENEVDRQIVRSIADLASVFSAKVCVEGIETSGMRDILNHYHVESFQGYYYAKPLMLEQFLTWRKRK